MDKIHNPHPYQSPSYSGVVDFSLTPMLKNIYFLSYISIFHLTNLSHPSLNPWYIYSVHRLMLEETQALRLRAEPGFIDSGVNYRQHINFVVLDYRKKGERKGQKKYELTKKI